MGTWAKVMSETYYGTSPNKTYASYTNSSSHTEFIVSMTAKLGVAGSGIVYNAGSTVTGNGQSLEVTMSCGESTATVTVTNTVGRSGSSGNYYPKYSDCDSYTFVFSSPIKVTSGATVNIKVTTGGGSVFVCHNSAPSGELGGNTVWICTAEAVGEKDTDEYVAPVWQQAIVWVCTAEAVGEKGTDGYVPPVWQQAVVWVCTAEAEGEKDTDGYVPPTWQTCG